MESVGISVQYSIVRMVWKIFRFASSENCVNNSTMARRRFRFVWSARYDIAAQVCSEPGKSPAKGFKDLVKESEELLEKKLAGQSASAPAS
jgi:hypothetical protein